MKKLYFSLFLLSFLFTLSINGQVAFSDKSQQLTTTDFHSGVAIGVVDMNGDGLDDIVRLNNARLLSIEYQTSSGQFQTYYHGQVSGNGQWSLCVADVDQNGYNDILMGGAYDGVRVLMADATGSSYLSNMLPGPDMFLQGSNFVDINNDGFVDVFGCHDDAESRVWGNDGGGLFFMADDWIDASTTPASDNSGNYGSIWTDFDNDGDLDLYIAKCRQGVNNPTDPRRINKLLVNEGDTAFVEKADYHGLKIGWQSWTSDFQDIDNDGDLDVFITNHDAPSMLLENTDGFFTDITESAGVDVVGTSIQGVMRDFDNDGFVDILVSGSSQYLYFNNGDKTFTLAETPFNQNDMESYALGDLNHDGFIDIYAGYANLFNGPSDIDDVLWYNLGNENNFIAFNLIGDSSNINGIGARLEIYGEWGKQIREVRSGESYGIMNSFTQHFGLGSSTEVDSLIVRWPSGVVDKHENLTANQFVTVIENNCVSPNVTITPMGPTVFCPGETLEIQATEGLEYLWSNGDTQQVATVTETGLYTVTVSNGGDCRGSAPSIEVIVDPEEIVEIAVEGDLTFCQGGSVILTSSEATSYSWSNGETTQSVEVSEPGMYTVSVQGLCSEFGATPVAVETLEPSLPTTYNDTISEPGVAVLTAEGDHLVWYDAAEGGQIIATGDTLTTPPIEESTTFYVENIQSFLGGIENVGLEEHTGNSNFSGNQFNASMFFDCLAPFTLKTVRVYTDVAGIRVIELRNNQNMVILSRQVDIPEGTSTVTLNFDIEPGEDYALSTNTNSNNQTFGYNSPRLRRTDTNNDLGYPFVIDEVVSITESEFGTNRWYYFYNWEVEVPSVECTSERVPVEAVIELINDTESPIANTIRMFPNPNSGIITTDLGGLINSEVGVRLFNAAGQMVYHNTVNPGSQTFSINIENLPAGVYFVKLQVEDEVVSKKIMKM